MTRYILRRLFAMPFLILGIVTLAFCLTAVTKGDPLTAIVSDRQMNNPEVVAAVQKVAKARGRSMAEVALAWVLQVNGVTSPIVGVSRMGHLDDAIAALDLTLDAEEVAALEAPYRTFMVTSL